MGLRQNAPGKPAFADHLRIIPPSSFLWDFAGFCFLPGDFREISPGGPSDRKTPIRLITVFPMTPRGRAIISGGIPSETAKIAIIRFTPRLCFQPVRAIFSNSVRVSFFSVMRIFFIFFSLYQITFEMILFPSSCYEALPRNRRIWRGSASLWNTGYGAMQSLVFCVTRQILVTRPKGNSKRDLVLCGLFFAHIQSHFA